MQRDKIKREPDPILHSSERSEAKEKWEKLLSDKLKAIQFAMSFANSTIKSHKLLILVDLQGIYLAFHKWLSAHGVPIDDGFIMGNFAHLQIERAAQEVAARVSRSQTQPTLDLKSLYESIEINYVDGKAYTGNSPAILQDGIYLDISMSFEMFYAPVPLKKIEGYLFKSARSGSKEAREQYTKIKSGIVKSKGWKDERNYSHYDGFVDYLKESTYHSCSHEGFFGYSVAENGLKYFDEKEVDIRIAIRAMDALYKSEADSICIVSADQDYMPLHSRADDFGITSFQADLKNFLESDRVGAKFKNLGDRFIRGGIDPSWPLEILTKAMSAPDIGHFASHVVSEEELHSLCQLHNELNDVKIKLAVESDGKASIKLDRPA